MLVEGCGQMGIHLNEAQIEEFIAYLKLLLRWGAKLNLTKILNEKEIVIKHFLDALSAFRAIEILPKQRIMDVGSGAGIPGIPIKIVQPAVRLTLLEPTQKKAAFLRTVCGSLKHREVTVLVQTAESAAHRLRSASVSNRLVSTSDAASSEPRDAIRTQRP